MSRYTLPFLDNDRIVPNTFIAYGFDHILGPFMDVFIDDECTDEFAYLFDRSFDCHELAFHLKILIQARAIPNVLRTHQHIRRLVLDLPI